MLQDGLSSL